MPRPSHSHQPAWRCIHGGKPDKPCKGCGRCSFRGRNCRRGTVAEALRWGSSTRRGKTAPAVSPIRSRSRRCCRAGSPLVTTSGCWRSRCRADTAMGVTRSADSRCPRDTQPAQTSSQGSTLLGRTTRELPRWDHSIRPGGMASARRSSKDRTRRAGTRRAVLSEADNTQQRGTAAEDTTVRDRRLRLDTRAWAQRWAHQLDRPWWARLSSERA
jgi:hypothetical protein